MHTTNSEIVGQPPEADLYECYKSFLRQGCEQTERTLRTDADRAYFRETCRPRSRKEFERALHEMDAATRSRYEAGLRAGYEQARKLWGGERLRQVIKKLLAVEAPV